MPDGPNAFAELRGDFDPSPVADEWDAEDASAPARTDEETLGGSEQPSLHGAFWTIITSMVLVTAVLIGTS